MFNNNIPYQVILVKKNRIRYKIPVMGLLIQLYHCMCTYAYLCLVLDCYDTIVLLLLVLVLSFTILGE